ncbi:hypothetical protein Lcho_3473 [Leptothrix cholodnii SP-6]|uniref:Uncharacterized protein n=1 Tax=Leptothrix cholodnii (strain ATCC 51168 / LMG 8142 / SP-6) TaxID=395495 RepID=B1Y3M6_LEPCP|nr:hypothetical protein [Leptothrix cholodnii]ACB35729.1 hypothetical protein Lcho_3473 [Leptothrix cholodnii SP-6]
MQTNPENDKGRHPGQAPAPMQTGDDPTVIRRPPRPFTPRQQRAIDALLQGPVQTCRLPRIAGVNNGPDLVATLREKLGLEIPCPMHKVSDRDGNRVEAGEYSLTAADRSKINAFMLALAADLRESGA